jgi:hypothetical protein
MEPTTPTRVNPPATAQQLVYARWLDIGMKIGFLILIGAFAAYVLELTTPQVPLAELHRFWNLPVDEYLAAAHVQAGWGWLEHIGRGDYMNLLGVAWLASVSIVCYIRLAPMYWKERDRVFTAIVALELIVLVAAASGVFGGGH